MLRFFNSVKEYLLLVFLLAVSLFFVSSDSSPGASKIKSYFFGTFAAVNSLFNYTFVQPLQVGSCGETEKIAAKLNLENEALRLHGLENAELKKALNYKENSDFDLLAAKIIGRNLEPTKSDLIINKGVADSVKEGMTVITPKGFVGLVTSAAENYSIVRTFENVKMRIPGELERTGVNGLVTWDGKNLVLKNIPTNYDLKKGDRIIVSPLSLRFVHEIPLGLVKEKITSVSGLFSDVIIKPFNDLRTVRYCFVVLNSDADLIKKIDALEK